MKSLHTWLEQEGIWLEIKRGTKVKKSFLYNIKNDELGQILLSFVHQQPGTSRNGKKKIFDTAAIYDKLFRISYEKDSLKKAFIKNLIELDSRYSAIEKQYKISGLNPIQTEVLKNGKQTIFALMGVCYRIVNADILDNDIINNPKSVATIPFVFGSMISNYQGDDLDTKLAKIIKDIVIIVTNAYHSAFKKGDTTSVSNYLKTDQKYYNDIVTEFFQVLDMLIGEDLKACSDIFKRA